MNVATEYLLSDVEVQYKLSFRCMKTSSLCARSDISFSFRERKHDSIICGGIRQSLDMSFGQTEQMIDKLPRGNVASMPLNLYEVWSLPGVFLFHCLFPFAEIADVLIWFSSVCLTKLWVRYADMARVHFPTRQFCLFPIDMGPCIIPILLIPSSQNVCP